VKALAYVWIPQEGEDIEGLVGAIREWAARSGVEVVSFYVEVGVGSAVPPRERPQYLAMLEAARALGIRLLVFYDPSGLGGGLEDWLTELRQLTEEGFDFKFVAREFLDYIQDPVLRKRVISDFLRATELYREDIRRRTRAAVARLKAEGKRVGRPPFPFPEEEVRRLLAQGHSIAGAHRLLTLERKICREYRGKTECMKYETFRRKVKALRTQTNLSG